jgi:hypothetical protein
MARLAVMEEPEYWAPSMMTTAELRPGDDAIADGEVLGEGGGAHRGNPERMRPEVARSAASLRFSEE